MIDPDRGDLNYVELREIVVKIITIKYFTN